jgi:hypothetical protein
MFPPQAQAMPADDSVIFASWLNLLLIGSCRAETDRSFDVCEQNIATLLRKQPRGVGLLLIAIHGDPVMENYSQRAQRMLKRFRPQLLCCAGVVEVRGFAGAAHRALGHTLISLTGLRGVAAMFGERGDAIPFMAERILPVEQRAAGAVAMRSAVERFRASMDEVRNSETAASR